MLRFVVLIFALVLMSEPFEPQDTYGWRALVRFVPAKFSEKRRFYTCIGSMACFHLLNTSASAQAFFRSRVMQYLGKISYGLYLVHSFVLHTLGYAMFNAVWMITGVETDLAKEVGFVIATAGIIPYAIYIADVFHRAVDEPSVNFAKWIENRVIVAD